MDNRVLLIDADSTIPNIALGKLSTYLKHLGNNVEFVSLNIPYYPNRVHQYHYINTDKYDKVYCSTIFEGSAEFVKGNKIEFGGTGFDLYKELPPEVEECDVDYSLYPNNDTSYGFITRGCIRNCPFCVVPRKEGNIRQVSSVDKIIRHKKVKFLDNNILAFPKHYDILKELVDKRVHCQFNQGLDIRLIDKDNSRLLSKMNYMGEYIFAFDDWEYLSLIERGISFLSWAKDWQLKFFCYTHPSMDLSNVVNRIEWMRSHKFLPYVMRHISCWQSEYSDFYVDLAAWCNQPNIFKKMLFDEFLYKRHPKNKERARKHEYIYKEVQNV